MNLLLRASAWIEVVLASQTCILSPIFLSLSVLSLSVLILSDLSLSGVQHTPIKPDQKEVRKNVEETTLAI